MPYTGSGSPHDSQAFPYRQLTILAICRISEPIAFMSIFPYIYYMIKSFHITDNDSQISFYAGLVTSAYALGEAMSSGIWGRLSDKFGRKPILLGGFAGTGLSMLIFGFSQNLQTALIARALGGLLNGNIGVIQTTVAEVVKNEEHQAIALSIMPTIWCIGAIIGSILGGTFADPVTNYPAMFRSGSIAERFLTRFPYLLPSLVCTTVVVIGVTVGLLFLEETHEDLKYTRDTGLEVGKWLESLFKKPSNSPVCCQKAGYPGETYSLLDTGDQLPDYKSTASSPELGATSGGPPPPYEDLDESQTSFDNRNTSTLAKGATIRNTSGVWHTLNTQLVLNIVGYGILAYHTISAEQLLPVLFSSPESDASPKLPFWFTGGFALQTKTIGAILSLQGVIQVVATFGIFHPIRRRLGTSTTFRLVVLSYPLLYFLVPYLTLVSVHLRMPAIFAILTWKVTAQAFAFPCIQLMLANAIPRRSLGTYNGFAQSSASLARAIGPTLSGFLQAAGLANGMLGFPWWFNACVALIGATMSLFMIEKNRLPIDSEKRDLEECEESAGSAISPDINAALIAAESTPDGLVSRPASPILVRVSMDIRRGSRRDSKA